MIWIPKILPVDYPGYDSEPELNSQVGERKIIFKENLVVELPRVRESARVKEYFNDHFLVVTDKHRYNYHLSTGVVSQIGARSLNGSVLGDKEVDDSCMLGDSRYSRKVKQRDDDSYGLNTNSQGSPWIGSLYPDLPTDDATQHQMAIVSAFMTARIKSSDLRQVLSSLGFELLEMFKVEALHTGGVRIVDKRMNDSVHYDYVLQLN